MRLLLALCVSIGIAVAAIAVAAGAQMLPSLDATGYWPQSLEPQGAAPPHWSAIEKALAPEACGQCHADQLAQWQTSRHAHAMSPGVLGQLITLDPSESAECMQCHAPLAEQRAAFEAARAGGVADRSDRLGLGRGRQFLRRLPPSRQSPVRAAATRHRCGGTERDHVGS